MSSSCSFDCIYYSLTAFYIFFFFNDTATSLFYTLSLHDALPISLTLAYELRERGGRYGLASLCIGGGQGDRKSTRLNSSHVENSYDIFCLKKKKTKTCTKNDNKKTKDNANQENINNIN